MSFDLSAIDEFDFTTDEGEKAFEEYRDALLSLFAASPEGKPLVERHPDMGHWAGSLLYFAFAYLGATLLRMKLSDVEEVVTEIFPRKISLRSPEEADNAVPELIAFWQYLEREYSLPIAGSVLQRLKEIEPGFTDMMNDPSKFGTAKSLFTMAQSAGFDMTKEDEANAFITLYNSQLAMDGAKRGIASEPRTSPRDGDPRTKRNKARKLRHKAAGGTNKRKRKGK